MCNITSQKHTIYNARIHKFGSNFRLHFLKLFSGTISNVHIFYCKNFLVFSGIFRCPKNYFEKVNLGIFQRTFINAYLGEADSWYNRTTFTNIAKSCLWYCSRSVLLRWELLEVIKWCPKPYSTIPLKRENRFNSVNSVPLPTLHFEISWHSKRMTLQNK